MLLQSPPSSRRGSCCAALVVLNLISTAIAQGREPASQPTTGPTSRGIREFRGPPLTSLNDVRLDRRMTLLNAGETLEPTAKLPDDAPSYVVELPSHKELILDLAKRADRPAPTVRLLPEESRTSDRYGIVTADHAILRKGVHDVPGDRENLSDVTLGEPVWILDQDEAKTSLLVHARDGYIGWVDSAAVWAVGREEFGAANARLSPRYWPQRLAGSFLAELAPKPSYEESVRSRDNAGLLRAATARPPGHISFNYESRVKKQLSTANALIGTRYVWGGKTKDGIDCSGLSQAASASVDVALPRDADQQSLVGRLVATRWDQSALLPGDLLFYVSPRRGNVHHVAIYLGDGEYIEAAGPDVHISSMKPDAPNYDGKRAETFGWARRVIE